jgi:hypothetical protein
MITRFDGQLAVPRGDARASAHDPEYDEQPTKWKSAKTTIGSIRTTTPMTRTTMFYQYSRYRANAQPFLYAMQKPGT